MKQIYQWIIERKNKLAFTAILLTGILARTWEIRTLPPGLHHDEASIAMESYYLLNYGVDRNNVSYPVHFISWGNGQNTPYAYLLMPLIALFGLRIPIIRIPILISGIATLPLIYVIFRRTVDDKFGLFAMFCIMISPWHILLSRWGVESNLLPFFFSIGYFFLLKVRDDWRWLIPANILFALCLYTYGITYAFLPIFLMASSVILIKSRMLTWKQTAIGFITLGTLGLPIILFVLINLLDLDTIHVGVMTIPRLPTLSRFQQEGVMFHEESWRVLFNFLKGLLYLLVFQNDFRLRNLLPPYGYFYGVTFPLALLGIWFLSRSMQTNREEKLLWFSWIGGSIILGLLEPVIANRINIIFIPWIGIIAYSIYWFISRFRFGMPIAIFTLLLGFALFNYSYHGKEYRREAGKEFYTGLLPALLFAQEHTKGEICITNRDVYMPYIFVLYTEQIPPSDLVSMIHYSEPVQPLREVDHMGRYTFGLNNCPDDLRMTYLLKKNEKPDHPRQYDQMDFDYFTLYLPRE